MIEIHKTEGEYIDYTTNSKSIIFGDDDLSLNLKNREMDEKVIIDICADKNGFLVVGTETGFKYVAQIEIPPREYTESDNAGNEEEYNYDPVPFNIDKCILYLWGE